MSDPAVGPILRLMLAMVRRAEADAAGKVLGRLPSDDPAQIQREAQAWLRELRGRIDEL